MTVKLTARDKVPVLKRPTEFPWIGASANGRLVLFLGHGPHSEKSLIGQEIRRATGADETTPLTFRNAWDADFFEPWTGTVTMESAP